jgi:hypothetical protein
MKENLYWINPISHYIYSGWLKFFDKYFNLEMYDENYTNVSYGRHFDLKKYKTKTFQTKINFINFYKNPIK